MRSICPLHGRPLGFLVIVLLLFTTAGAVLAQSERKPSPITKVVLLGTGTPIPDPDQFGPSVAIVVNNTPYLIDLGPGVIRRASAAVRKGVDGPGALRLKTGHHASTFGDVAIEILIVSAAKRDALVVNNQRMPARHRSGNMVTGA